MCLTKILNWRGVLFVTIVAWVLLTIGFAAQQAPASTDAPSQLDFEFFKTQVQPVFLAKRPGHARCVSCHITSTPMRLQPLTPGSGAWDDKQSRQNFEVVRQRVIPGSLKSMLLIHPLATEAGGDAFHAGGKHWDSQNAPEWQTLAAWVRGAKADTSTKLRIIQTNSAGDNIHLIDPVTNKVVGEIKDIEVNHGAAAAPDGSRMYFSNESLSTLDIVDARTLRVTNRVLLSGRPNNIALSRDGRRVYVAIVQEPGAVDVIDTASQERVKTIPAKGGVHNTFVTPDGKYVIAGSIVGKIMTVINQQTEQPVWSLEFDLGVRPMAFEQNADGSTKRIFVQLSEFHGFAVVDFQTRKEVTRITLPPLPPGKVDNKEGGNISHGMAVTADGKTLVVTSRQNSALYSYSLPELKLLGGADVGLAPDWVTLTPDSKTAYVANAGSNSVSVIDIKTMKEVTRIPVGHVPKRNTTAMLQVQ
ncbi:MAG: beta-propeller fold lactonase family protein [Chloracidobacterium sp.]|nr:beta-propeller fold lactonase family protein [Chloracidobacterium sp.]